MSTEKMLQTFLETGDRAGCPFSAAQKAVLAASLDVLVELMEETAEETFSSFGVGLMESMEKVLLDAKSRKQIEEGEPLTVEDCLQLIRAMKSKYATMDFKRTRP